jgi:hypothetical protein
VREAATYRAWHGQCRLRSETLPLMQTLAVSPASQGLPCSVSSMRSPMYPPPDAAPAVGAESTSAHQHMDLSSPPADRLGPPIAAAVEDVTHFLADCEAPAMKQLRGQPCVRIREATNQSRSEQPQQPQTTAVDTTHTIEVIVQRMELRNSSGPSPSPPLVLDEDEEAGREEAEATRAWCELIPGAAESAEWESAWCGQHPWGIPPLRWSRATAGATAFFNEILRHDVWPERWCMGLIYPIESNLDNYRPITLLSVVSKLFEILLNTRLMGWAEKNRVLCDEQGGFRTKRGCADQLFILKEVWSSRYERKHATYSAFLDVKSAYDRVWRTGL